MRYCSDVRTIWMGTLRGSDLSYEKKTRLLRVDDHRVVRRGFKLILATAPDLEVVAEVSDGREALGLAKMLQPNVVVIDASMPGWNGIESTIRILGSDMLRFALPNATAPQIGGDRGK